MISRAGAPSRRPGAVPFDLAQVDRFADAHLADFLDPAHLGREKWQREQQKEGVHRYPQSFTDARASSARRARTFVRRHGHVHHITNRTAVGFQLRRAGAGERGAGRPREPRQCEFKKDHAALSPLSVDRRETGTPDRLCRRRAGRLRDRRVDGLAAAALRGAARIRRRHRLRPARHERVRREDDLRPTVRVSAERATRPREDWRRDRGGAAPLRGEAARRGRRRRRSSRP